MDIYIYTYIYICTYAHTLAGNIDDQDNTASISENQSQPPPPKKRREKTTEAPEKRTLSAIAVETKVEHTTQEYNMHVREGKSTYSNREKRDKRYIVASRLTMHTCTGNPRNTSTTIFQAHKRERKGSLRQNEDKDDAPGSSFGHPGGTSTTFHQAYKTQRRHATKTKTKDTHLVIAAEIRMECCQSRDIIGHGANQDLFGKGLRSD